MSQDPQNVVIAAFTEEQAERLTGVSQRQLRYWTNDAFFLPSLAYPGDEDGLPAMRLYSFRDLVCLNVISTLRNEANIPLSQLRKVKSTLSHLGDDLWAKTTLFVLGRKVVFVNPENGERQEALTGQGVRQIPLMVVTGNMEDAVRAMRVRETSIIGQIDTKTRGKNNPVIAGTRITVDAIRSFSEAGYSFKAIMNQYPTLKEEDIQAALDFRVVA